MGNLPDEWPGSRGNARPRQAAWPAGKPGGDGRVPSGSRRMTACPGLSTGSRAEGRSAALGLRHGPDSCRRQRWGILRNGGNLTQRRRVQRKALRPQTARRGQITTVPAEEAANYVPAAAVVRRGRRCPDSLGVKARRRPEGRGLSGAQPTAPRFPGLRVPRSGGTPRCSGGMRRYPGGTPVAKAATWAATDAEARESRERTGLDTYWWP